MARRANSKADDIGNGVDDAPGPDGGNASDAIGSEGLANAVDPASVTGAGTVGTDNNDNNAGSGGTKRRGRKPGSKNRTAKTAASLELNAKGLAGILLSVHSTLATLSKTPEFEIDENEANAITASTLNLMEQYSVVIDPKAAAWVQFSLALGSVYGPRVIAISVRRSRDKDAKKRDADFSNVTPMQPGGGYVGQQ